MHISLLNDIKESLKIKLMQLLASLDELHIQPITKYQNTSNSVWYKRLLVLMTVRFAPKNLSVGRVALVDLNCVHGLAIACWLFLFACCAHMSIIICWKSCHFLWFANSCEQTPYWYIHFQTVQVAPYQ